MIRGLPIAVLALSACVPGGFGGNAAVTPDRAVALLDSVCGAGLPDFAFAPALFEQNGITRPSDAGDGRIFAATEDASFRIVEGPGLGQTCEMIVGTTDPAGTLDALRAVTGGMQDTDFGPAGLYRGRKALLIVPAAAAEAGAGGRTYIDVQLLSERIDG
jgi:hypothetical protein